MSARQPRRSFATPFVITLAAGAACTPRATPTPPPGPITTTPETTTVETPPVETPPVETPPVETPPVATPPAETPPSPPVKTLRWQANQVGQKCTTQLQTDCSEPPCEPGPKVKYDCPKSEDGTILGIDGARIEGAEGQASCTLRLQVRCPPSARCNPPPPRSVPCPKQ